MAGCHGLEKVLTCKELLLFAKKKLLIGRKIFATRSMPKELAMLPTNHTIPTHRTWQIN